MYKYIIITILLVVIELLYLYIAKRLHINSDSNAGIISDKRTVCGGGIIFPIAAITSILYNHLELPYFLIGLVFISIISLRDDYIGLPVSLRLIFHFICIALLVYECLFHNGNTSFPFWLIAIYVIVGVGIVNAFNFMDGVNGMTGGYCLGVLVPIILLNKQIAFIEPSVLYSILIAVIIFCYFNFRRKALCYAGDVGAISIGFIIVYLLLAAILHTQSLWYMIFVSVYGVDVVMTLINRLIIRQNLFVGHNMHLYQILIHQAKIPVLVVPTFYASVQTFISLGALYLPVNRYVYAAVTISVMCIVYVILVRKYYARRIM